MLCQVINAITRICLWLLIRIRYIVCNECQLSHCSTLFAVPAVAAAALRGWSLLLSALSGHDLRRVGCDSDGEGGTTDGIERRLTSLSKALTSSDVGVRQAAGEAAALLYAVSDLAGDQESASASECVCWLISFSFDGFDDCPFQKFLIV